MLVYALVARGPPAPILPLAEFCVIDDGDDGDFAYTAEQYLHIIDPTSNPNISIIADNLSFHYLLHDGFTYCVVTDHKNIGDPIYYLNFVRNDFIQKYGDGEEIDASTPAYGLNDEFGPILKDCMFSYYKYYESEYSVMARERQRQMMMRQTRERNRQKKENALSTKCKRLLSKTICGNF